MLDSSNIAHLDAAGAVLTAKGFAPRTFRVHGGEGQPGPGDLVSVATYAALVESGATRDGLGVIVAPADDAATVRPWLGELAAIAIDFPAWRDGRGYTHARRLRHHFGFNGPIIAVGDVLRDQLQYMWRSGMDHFHLRADQDLAGCLNAFRLFSVFYQYPPA